MADRRIKLEEGVVADFGSMTQPSGKALKTDVLRVHRVDAALVAQYNPATLRQAVSFTSRNGVPGFLAK
jgi:hypothetical protein